MQSQEKKDLMELAEKFGSDIFLKYVKNADPNETGTRNLLEIVMVKLTNAYDLDETSTLNDALSLMIDRGLDTSRRVHTSAYSSDGFVSPTLLQAASNTENISNKVFMQIFDKEVKNLAEQPNSGQNIMIGRVQNTDIAGFDALLKNNVKLPPKLAEEALKVLTAVSSVDDDPVQKKTILHIGKELIKMNPNLFNIRMFNNTQSFEDVLSERGQEELASIIKTIKIESTIERQEIVEVADADVVYDSTYSRGI